jgi:hypothetical protein
MTATTIMVRTAANIDGISQLLLEFRPGWLSINGKPSATGVRRYRIEQINAFFFARHDNPVGSPNRRNGVGGHDRIRCRRCCWRSNNHGESIER